MKKAVVALSMTLLAFSDAALMAGNESEAPFGLAWGSSVEKIRSSDLELQPLPVGSARAVPIVIHGNSEEFACASTGVVKLEPNGDGFLAVRAGPSPNFLMTDKIFNGQEVWLCEEIGSWLGVVYPPNNHKIVDTGESCNVNNLWRKTLPYTGPCKFGWVFKQYIVGQSG